MDRVLASFQENVWSQRFRCLGCHSAAGTENKKLVAEHGEPMGRYLVKVFVDVNERLRRDWQSVLGEPEFVGEAIVETKWPSGYGRMTTIEANQLSRVSTLK
jgi:hypothetical protein